MPNDLANVYIVKKEFVETPTAEFVLSRVHARPHDLRRRKLCD
jgi:hypothetical protein